VRAQRDGKGHAYRLCRVWAERGIEALEAATLEARNLVEQGENKGLAK